LLVPMTLQRNMTVNFVNDLWRGIVIKEYLNQKLKCCGDALTGVINITISEGSSTNNRVRSTNSVLIILTACKSHATI